jgi:DNA polymerase-3 subunit alpha
VVAEREAHGWFASLEEVFRRCPPGTMNRRLVEGLAAAGAFDSLEPNRARVFANIDILLAAADEAERSRSSGQAALFGGEDHAAPALRLADAPEWNRAERMAKEREFFGFYFAAHPVEQYRAIASANGALSYSALMASGGGGAGPGERRPAVMAALVEGVSRSRTRKGRDFIRADFSDNSGQFSASCFEEALVESFQAWAREGTCLLLNVELDSPSPDEPPRITVRSARPLADVTSAAKMMLQLEVSSADAVAELALLLPRDPAGTGEVRAKLRTAAGSEPVLSLGRDFHLDADLVERLIGIEGLANVALTARSQRSLRLVS